MRETENVTFEKANLFKNNKKVLISFSSMSDIEIFMWRETQIKKNKIS